MKFTRFAIELLHEVANECDKQALANLDEKNYPEISEKITELIDNLAVETAPKDRFIIDGS